MCAAFNLTGRLAPHLAQTPRIINVKVPQTGWSPLGELAVTDSG